MTTHPITLDKPMLAFTGTAATKAQLVASLEAHHAADRIVQGRYWEDGRGCAVGCSLHDFGAQESDHSAYERLFGIPRVLARLEDGIFERLPPAEARGWPLRFTRAIREGADLSLVWPRFAVFLLVDKEYGVVQFVNEKSRLVVEAVAALYSRQIAGETVDREEFRQAAAAADDAAAAAAAAYAAYAAAYAAYAAYAAAYAAYAAYAAAYAAYAAAYDRFHARKGGREAAVRAQANHLIALLEVA